jgi:hypothetical protein
VPIQYPVVPIQYPVVPSCLRYSLGALGDDCRLTEPTGARRIGVLTVPSASRPLRAGPRALRASLYWGSPPPHLRQDWAHPRHICTRTGQCHPCHICAGTGLTPTLSSQGTGLTPPTSSPGLGSPQLYLRRDWAAGVRMAELPLEPMMARMLLAGAEARSRPSVGRACAGVSAVLTDCARAREDSSVCGSVRVRVSARTHDTLRVL